MLTYVDERRCLDWDSTFDPFTSASFRRGSLVLDPAAFDSTPSVNTVPELRGRSASLRLRKSAEALKYFGRRILPQLKLKTLHDEQAAKSTATDRDLYQHSIHKLSSPISTDWSSPARTRSRSNTIESTRSSHSIRSKRSSSNFAQTDALLSGDLIENSGDLKSPLATYRSTLTHGTLLPSHVIRDDVPDGIKSHSTPPVASSSIASGVLATLPEQHATGATPVAEAHPRILPAFGPTDPGLEEIMRQMQEDDEAFAYTEESMRRSGWSSENDINELRQRRNEQSNLWQRQLEDALDQVKAARYPD